MLVLNLLLQRFRSYAAEWKLDLQKKVIKVNKVFKINNFNLRELDLIFLNPLIRFRFLMENISKYIENENIAYVLLDICDYLDLVLERSINELKSSNQNVVQNEVIWVGNDTQILELATAMFEANSFKNKTGDLSRKQVIEFFEAAFNKKIKYPESKLSKARGRKRSSTSYIDSLKSAFINQIDEKEKFTPSKS